DIRSMVHRHAGGGKAAMAIIREGKVLPGPDGKARDEARGEGILFVDSTSAVLLASDTRPTRVLEPGLHFMFRDEKIGAVVDLRIQTRRKDVEAQTRDGIWVTFKINARFRIDKTKLKLEEINLDQVRWPAPYEWSPRQVVLALGQSRVGIEQGESLRWDDIVINEAVKRAHILIAEYTFDRLIEPHDPRVNPREDIRKRLEDDVKKALAGRGIAVLGIGLTQFVPRDKRVDVQRVEAWKAEWLSRLHVVEAEGLAERYRLIELARAQGQMELITRIAQALEASQKVGVDDAEEVALSLLEVVERLAAEPGIDERLGSESRAALSGAYKMLGKGLGSESAAAP
ncbi:MAG TPA: SPFH domain-containing protein, partial [Anaerolineae bacterium]|nr:SPFH domain-containing protein [Anaerolineae bacterium]